MAADTTSYEADDLLPIGEALKLVPISKSTLIRAETAGKISAVRTPGGHRRYRRADIEKLLASPNGATA